MEVDLGVVKQSICVVYKGRLVFVDCVSNTIKVTSSKYEYSKRSISEAVCETSLTSKQALELQCVECAQNNTGKEKEGLFVLLSSKHCTGKPTHICLIKVVWKCNGAASTESVELVPFMELSCSDRLNVVSALADGPRIIVIGVDGIVLCHKDKKGKVVASGFTIDDDYESHSESKTSRGGGLRSISHRELQILSLASDFNWIIAILLSDLDGKRTAPALALEKASSDEWQKTALSIRQFFPVDYVEKVKTVKMITCQRIVEEGKAVYRNKIAVGLDDGFVMVFSDGRMLNCMSVCSPASAMSPGPVVSVQKVVVCNNAAICLDDTARCVAFSLASGKVCE
jgi:hypothetical protein